MPADLPTFEDVELAEYKLGSLLSDLDGLITSAKACSQVMPVQEYVYRKAEGFDPPEGEQIDYDRDQIARLAIFAVELEQDAETIRDYARNLKDEALSLYREHGLVTYRRDPAGWKRYKDRVADWHREGASFYDG